MKYIYEDNNFSLRILDESCTSEIFSFYNDNRLHFDPYDADKPDNFYSLEFISSMIRAENNAFMHLKYMRYYFFNKNSNEIIGCVSFTNINTATLSCSIGYKIAHKYTNHGYGKKMVAMALGAIVSDFHIHRVEAYIHPDNLYSIKLCQSLGFIPEGTAHAYVRIGGQWLDHLRYAYIV